MNIDHTCNAFFDPNEHTLNFFSLATACLISPIASRQPRVRPRRSRPVPLYPRRRLQRRVRRQRSLSTITHDSIIGRDFQSQSNQSPRRPGHPSTWPPTTWKSTRRPHLRRLQLGADPAIHSRSSAARTRLRRCKAVDPWAAALNPKDTPDAVRLSFLSTSQNGSPFFNELAARPIRSIPRPDRQATQHPAHYRKQPVPNRFSPPPPAPPSAVAFAKSPQNPSPNLNQHNSS